MPIFAQPPARVLIVRARVRDKAPEVTRMIEPAQMHELMNEDVVADRVRHQEETPVQTDVT